MFLYSIDIRPMSPSRLPAWESLITVYMELVILGTFMALEGRRNIRRLKGFKASVIVRHPDVVIPFRVDFTTPFWE